MLWAREIGLGPDVVATHQFSLGSLVIPTSFLMQLVIGDVAY